MEGAEKGRSKETMTIRQSRKMSTNRKKTKTKKQQEAEGELEESRKEK